MEGAFILEDDTLYSFLSTVRLLFLSIPLFFSLSHPSICLSPNENLSHFNVVDFYSNFLFLACKEDVSSFDFVGKFLFQNFKNLISGGVASFKPGTRIEHLKKSVFIFHIQYRAKFYQVLIFR